VIPWTHISACLVIALKLTALGLALLAALLIAIGVVVLVHDFIVGAKNRWRQP
jgi:hypothetical protein